MSESTPDEIVRGAVTMTAARLRRQHEAAVRFGLAALNIDDIDAVLDEACTVVARGLGSRFAKVLRYLPDEKALLLEAGIGWLPNEIGTVKLAADDSSPAGYAYLAGKPVLSNHLGEEHRFRTPDLLRRHGVKRAINVPIRTTADAYGVLEADSDNGEDFLETDIVFLEAVANVIAMSRERISIAHESGHGEVFLASVLNASNDVVIVMDTAGDITFINQFGLLQFEAQGLLDAASHGATSGNTANTTRANALTGRSWPMMCVPNGDVEAPNLPEMHNTQTRVTSAVEAAARGESTRFEAPWLIQDGAPRWWDMSIAPMRDKAGQLRYVVAICRDITERHGSEILLARLLSEQETQINSNELMMKEVHHRVRNSLQLVQTLLSLQGSLSGDESIKGQLQTAGSRVMTVGLVHQRLYQDNGAQETDARKYLQELIGDLQGSADDRTLVFRAPSLVLPAKRLAPLGLVTAELVMNALKYGKGTVTITLAAAEAGLKLSVEDEGPGFPDDFPQPKGTGLGMRLVKTYSGMGERAVSVDRSVPHSHIEVLFRSV